MKRSLFILLCLSLTFISFVPHFDISTEKGKEEWKRIQSQKHYILPFQIIIKESGMYINFKDMGCNEDYRVSEILEDEKGIYVRYFAFYWVCSNGHINPPWNSYCLMCGINK